MEGALAWIFRHMFIKSERLGKALLDEVGRNSPCTEDVRCLLDTGANANYCYGCHCVLAMAARSPWCSADIVRLLLERGANVNGTQKPDVLPPLLVAAHQSDAERLRLLIDAGADVNACDEHYGRTVLSELCQWADLFIIDYVLARGADPNKLVFPTTRTRPVHFAAYVGRDDVIDLLVWYGADATARTEEGYTAGYICANHVELTCYKR